MEIVKVKKSRTNILKLVVRDKAYLLMVALPFLYYVIFHYLPMYGIIIAFKDYRVGRGFLGSEWVGFKWFVQFFYSPYFWRLIKNTFALSALNIVFGFPAPIILSLFFNEMKSRRYKKIVQTVSYLPHFISTVIVVGILYNLFSVNGGLVNVLLERLGKQPINFFSISKWFRPLFVGSGIWQEMGFGTIIYLAAIAGIDQALYDAASVDGCSRFMKNIYITIPSIMPTIVILLILNLGRILSVGFEKIILMYTPVIYDVSDVISTYVYRQGILNAEFSYSTAIGLFNSVVNLIFLISFNHIARKVSETSLW